MKIAFITGEYPPETIGGIGIYVRTAAKLLSAHGHHTEVFTATHGGASVIIEDGVVVHRIKCASRQAFSSAVVDVFAERHAKIHFDVYEVPELFCESAGVRSSLPTIPCLVRVHSPTFIAHELNERAFSTAGRWLHFLRFFLGCVLNRRSPAPAFLYGSRGVWRKPSYDPTLDPERRAALNANLIVIPSNAMLRRLCVDWQLPSEQVLLLPNLYHPPEELLNISRPPDRTNVLFFGRLIAFKGVLSLATALKLVRKQFGEFDCTFAGESGLSPRTRIDLRSFLRGAVIGYEDTYALLRDSLGDSVKFVGKYNEQSLPDLLSAADICVLPSWWDNFPSACLEAMAAGRAIIATNSGGMADMLDDGDCGILIEPNNPHELANALLQLLRNPSLRQELGHRARERVKSIYSKEALIPHYEAAYAACIDQHGINAT